MAKIVTGHKGIDHITSDDVSSFQQGIVGDDDYLLSDNPDEFVATIGTNNTISLCDADIVIQGTHARIFATDTIQIEQGTSEVTRIDSIVARYTRDEDGVEDVTVIAKTGTTEPPELEQTDIRGAGTVREVALWNVPLNGNVMSEPVRVIPVVNSINALQQSLATNITLTNQLKSLYDSLFDTVSGVQNNIEIINSNILDLNSKSVFGASVYLKDKSNVNQEIFNTQFGEYISTYKSNGGEIDITAAHISLYGKNTNSDNLKCQHIFYSDGNKAILVGNKWYSQPFIQRGLVDGTPKTKSSEIVGSVTIDKKTYNVTKDFYACDVPVSFPKPYSSTPTILLTVNSSVANKIFCGVTSATKTGFNIHIERWNTNTTTIHWTALGSL